MKIQSTGCVILDTYDRFLLLHRAGDDRPFWDLPGGVVQEEEVPEAVALLEVREQLGVDVRLTAHLGSGDYEDDENSYQCHWFQARLLAGRPDIVNPAEADDFDYFELDDLMSLALSPSMQLLLPRILDGDVALRPADEV